MKCQTKRDIVTSGKYFFLFSYRFNATDDDIRRAYRKIVLKHHPDKRKAQGEEIRQEDDYFTCITKAYETLGKNFWIDRGRVLCVG